MRDLTGFVVLTESEARHTHVPNRSIVYYPDLEQALTVMAAVNDVVIVEHVVCRVLEGGLLGRETWRAAGAEVRG